MPDPNQSTALRKFRASFPPAKREIQTLELRQRRQDVADTLDVVFVLDITSGMQSQIDLLYTCLDGLDAGLADEYPSRRYALVTFKDEDATATPTGASLVTFATFKPYVAALAASGGGGHKDNGYGALLQAAKLPFRDEAARAVVLVTNSTSHSRGATFLAAKFKLLATKCVLFSGIGHDDPGGYDALAVATSGGLLPAAATTGALTASLLDALKGIANPVADPIYLTNDTTNVVATLETGSVKTFLSRSFIVNPFLSGEDGSPSISLTVDNSDLAVSRFLAVAKKFPLPLEVTLRVYLSNDLSTPQNNPPIRLFAKEFEIKGTTAACQLRWLDLANAPFPNSFYTATKCPSLQG